MNSFYYICAFVVLFCGIGAQAQATFLVHATNYTKVPSAMYIVDAVKCLNEAYGIYADDEARAQLYVELFTEKHPGKWDALVGYTAFYGQPDCYIETIVIPEKKDKKDKKDKDGGVRFLLISADSSSNVTTIF